MCLIIKQIIIFVSELSVNSLTLMIPFFISLTFHKSAYETIKKNLSAIDETLI